MRSKRRLAVLVAILVALVVGLLVSRALRRPPPNVLLVSVDTLRWDRLGCYGYGRETTPNLDALAAEGVLFANAYSQSGWTLPSMATLLTGLHPRQHGATRFDTALRARIPTLATILKDEGYATRAFVSHTLVSGKYGLDRGFDRFDSTVLERGHPAHVSTSAELTDRAIEELERTPEPFLLWVHYFDPHALYLPHQGFEFGDAETDRYDGEIAHNDHQIGRLLAAARERGLLERTVVVVTADHGEEFGEHGGQHHFSLHEEVLRVPLILGAPSLPARVVEQRVQQVDLLPTLLGLLGLPANPIYPGRDALGEPAPGRPVYAERYQPNAFRQRAVIAGRYKLIDVDLNPEPAAYAGTFEYDELARIETGRLLYDLVDDPAETRDLLAERGEEAARLLALLEQGLAPAAAAEPTLEVTEEMRDSLRALGYIQ